MSSCAQSSISSLAPAASGVDEVADVTSRPALGLSSLPTRLTTAIAYAAVFCAAIIWGGPLAVAVLCALLAGGAALELSRIIRDRHVGLGSDFLAVAFCAITPIAVTLWGPSVLSLIAVLALTSIAIRHLVQTVPLGESSASLFAIVYLGLSIAHFPMIRALEDGLVLSLTVLISVWANDVFAFVIGSVLGRHKLAPSISPNKSWEGFVAGTCATIAVWVAAASFADTGLDTAWSVAMGLLIALVATGGDLFESRIKREAGVKDSGNALPGHGGFLDRIDSLVAVSFVAYYALLFAGAK